MELGKLHVAHRDIQLGPYLTTQYQLKQITELNVRFEALKSLERIIEATPDINVNNLSFHSLFFFFIKYMIPKA